MVDVFGFATGPQQAKTILCEMQSKMQTHTYI